MSEVKKGRKFKVDPLRVAGYRQSKSASIAETAKHFGISPRTVASHCREYGEPARKARTAWLIKRKAEGYENGIAEGDHDFAVLMAQIDLWEKGGGAR